MSKAGRPPLYDEKMKRITVTFPVHLHEYLKRIAEERDSSVSELMRRAVEVQYQTGPESERPVVISAQEHAEYKSQRAELAAIRELIAALTKAARQF